MTGVVTPVDSAVYYTGVYWNSYPEVVQHLNRRAFDADTGNWCEFVLAEHGRPYQRGLSLNCGTGWVERDLITAGAVKELVAVDYLDDLLVKAREASTGLPITYVQGDSNAADFPHGPYDLVVNHAAGHHIAYLDRVFRRLRDLMDPQGTLVTWDYTGAHRNQYSTRVWEAAMQANQSLPPQYRSEMRYPHLKTMLADDPTEAIHSELILETMGRYFEFRHFRRLGGPVAYLVLTHNERLWAAPEDVRHELISAILDADVRHIEAHPEDSLFTFALSTPRPAEGDDPVRLQVWREMEDERERVAAQHDGRYYLPTPLELAVYPVEPPQPPSPDHPVDRGVAAFAMALARRVPPLRALGRKIRSMTRSARSTALRSENTAESPAKR